MILGGVLCTLTAIVLFDNSLASAGDSRSKVKASATAGKIDENGKQLATVTLLIEKKWHLYANPVKNEDFDSNKTVVKVFTKVNPVKVEIQYPEGKLYKDKSSKISFMVYEEKVEIPVVVQRAGGDVSPLEIEVTFSACDDRACLLPATLRLLPK